MSGHSKWSKVKHQKAVTDVVKGRAFTQAARAITIAVLEGGRVGDPNLNFHLRLAIEKARDVNVPKENIERAIEKGMGTSGATIEQVLYEGYGPHGVAVLVEAATDNKQRTVSIVKNYFSRAGCSLASPGSVTYLFERSGICTLPKQAHSSDALFELALEAGASDVVETTDMIEVYCLVPQLAAMKQQLSEKGIVIDNTEIIMRARTPVVYENQVYEQIEQFIHGLEDLDDVQKVYTNL